MTQRKILHLNNPPKTQRAVACVGGCGKHFISDDPAASVCESAECKERVAQWHNRRRA